MEVSPIRGGRKTRSLTSFACRGRTRRDEFETMVALKIAVCRLKLQMRSKEGR